MRGVLVNHGSSGAGLPACIAATTIPILQDDLAGSLWAAVGTPGYAVVAADGTVVARFNGGTLPAVGPQLEAAVAPLLGGR